jgi:mono/diheme cytochrome c family protein
MIEESIVDPNAKIATGYPENVMPLNFEETLSPKELEDLVQYLSEETGGEGAAPKGNAGGAGAKAKPAG